MTLPLAGPRSFENAVIEIATRFIKALSEKLDATN